MSMRHLFLSFAGDTIYYSRNIEDLREIYNIMESLFFTLTLHHLNQWYKLYPEVIYLASMLKLVVRDFQCYIILSYLRITIHVIVAGDSTSGNTYQVSLNSISSHTATSESKPSRGKSMLDTRLSNCASISEENLSPLLSGDIISKDMQRKDIQSGDSQNRDAHSRDVHCDVCKNASSKDSEISEVSNLNKRHNQYYSL